MYLHNFCVLLDIKQQKCKVIMIRETVFLSAYFLTLEQMAIEFLPDGNSDWNFKFQLMNRFGLLVILANWEFCPEFLSN